MTRLTRRQEALLEAVTGPLAVFAFWAWMGLGRVLYALAFLLDSMMSLFGRLLGYQVEFSARERVDDYFFTDGP